MEQGFTKDSFPLYNWFDSASDFPNFDSISFCSIVHGEKLRFYDCSMSQIIFPREAVNYISITRSRLMLDSFTLEIEIRKAFS